MVNFLLFQMRCSENKECRMLRSRDGTMRPRCLWRDARECSEKMCQWGQRCEMREGKPACREETRTEKCRSTWCREGHRCDNGTCTPRTCAEMNCRRDEECRDWNRGWETIRRCVRRPTRERRCKDLDCDEGFKCRMVRWEGANNSTRPVCRRSWPSVFSPPRRFGEISCRDNEDWAMCESENRDRVTRCWRRDARWSRNGSLDERWQRNWGRDDGWQRNWERDDSWQRNWGRDDRRRPPWNCSELRCWEDERCHVFRYWGMQMASCRSNSKSC